MDFTASNGAAGGSYERPKAGTYTGVLIGFADVGTHTGKFGPKKQVMLRWELHKRKGPCLGEGGHILTQIAMYNQSFDAKSNLRAVIEAHIGAVADNTKVHSQDWLGTAAKLVLKESDDGKYVNVDAVTPLDPEEDERPANREALEHWESTDTTPPPGWCKWRIDQSDETTGIRAKANGTKVPVGAGVGADEDGGDIPF